jgi:flagellar capping protein FliD
MGSELALSGLASGFDWQPVVEQLIELEAIPKKRLQLEKRQNDEKMSELGLLKGQLDTLKGAATALQDDDLFEARKGSLDEDAVKFMAANIKAGAMTGNYEIEVSLLGSSTLMSSIRRKPLGLGKSLGSLALGLDTPLKSLPLQTAITKGTFTVSSRTYDILDLDETLQQLMDRIAADPEEDDTAVSLEYDSINDKMIVDGNELINDPNFTDTPILGSPTDSSNFLKVLRLLDQVSLNRDADYEGDSGISIWSGSAASLTNPEKAAWLRQDDEDEGGGAGLAGNDDKIYTANGNPTGKEVLYRRKAVHDQHDETKGYSTGDVVYRHGYLYEALQDFPTVAWTKTVDAINTKVSLSSLSHDFWELKKNLLTDRVGNSTGQATFSAAVDTGGGAGQYHIPTASTAGGATGLGDAYKAGDIVKAADGSYFRAVQDRKIAIGTVLANLTSTEDFGNIGQALVTSKNANAVGWTTIAGVAGAPDEFHPNHIFVKGRIYEAKTTNGFAEHDGITGQVNFSGNDDVVGNEADATVNKKFFRANATWNNVATLPNTSTAHPALWTAGQFVQADDNNFYEAHADWANVTTHSTTKNYDPAVANLKYVHTGTPSTNFYEAKAAWTNVTDFANGGDVGASFNTGKYVFHTGQQQFYQAQQDLNLIAAKAEKTIYNAGGTMAQQFVKDGSGASTNFYKAKGNWAGVTDYTENTAVAGINTNDYRRLLTDGSANKRIYKALANLGSFAAHATTTNHTVNDVVENGGKYWKAKLTTADQLGAGAFSTGIVEPMTLGQRALDTTNGKAFTALQPVVDITNHAATTHYSTGNEVVAGGGSFWQAQQVIAHQTGVGAFSTGIVEPMTLGQRAHDSVSGKVFTAKQPLVDITIHNPALSPPYSSQVVAGGGSFWQAQQVIAEADYTSAGGIASLALGNIVANDRVLNTTQGKVYKALSNLGATASFAAGSSYAPGTLVEDAGNYYKFTADYNGEVTSPAPATSSAIGQFVKATGGNFYKSLSATANSDLALVGTGGDPGEWQDTGINTLSGLVGSLVSDETTAVTKPTANNTYWTEETAATTLANNGYWLNVDSLVKTPTATNIYWTEETAATTLANNGYWLNVDTAVKTPTASNTYWTLEAAATALAENAYWTEVTDAVTLNGQDASAADTAYWEDVTTDIVNFPGGGTLAGGSIQDEFWEYVPEMAITTPLGAGASNAYWSEVSSTLTDLTGSWWTDASADLKNKSNPAWWTDETSTLNDLTDTNWWGETTNELTNPGAAGFPNWWTEIAHANGDGVGEFDPDYWQQITPGMTRVANNAVVANAVDHSIWKQVGNLQASAGDDGNFGLHDTNEDAMRKTDAVKTHAASTPPFSIGTILEATDSNSGVANYYKARATTSTDPANPANANVWELLGPKSSMTEDQAYGFTHTDPDFWQQNDTPTPGVTAGWESYWDTLTETVLTSSQPLGSVSLTEKIANANFAGFAGGNFDVGGDVFYIGEGNGAVRIDYNVNDDTVADLIQKVNDSDANVTMYYDPVGDKFVVQNNADGAIGITLHERPTWDSMSANAGDGNILELMGLATPESAADYTVFNNSSGYSRGAYVKETIGLTTTYWQALEDVGAGQTLDRSNPKWEQVARGIGRAASSELGNNYAIKINDGETIYNNTASFDETVHGYEGITFDVSGGAVGDKGTVKIERDSNPARNAIGKFVTEFNDAQDYIRSLVAVNQDGDNITAGTFSSNIEISRLGSQLRKIVFGDSYGHSESKIAEDGTDITVSTHALLTNVQADLGFGSSNAGYQAKVKADETKGGIINYYEFEWNAGVGTWKEFAPQFSSFRLANIGLDFGTGSDRLSIKDSSKLTEELLDNPDKVQALFAEATATADDKNTGKSNRQYQGLTYNLNDFLSNFLSGDSDSGYKGTYQAHSDSIRAQNKRIDERIEDLERYLEQRERALTQGFIRMEEMQSKISTQMQTLTNSFASNK